MTTEEALQLSAQAWCDETTKTRVMDPQLCEVFAKILKRETDNLKQRCLTEIRFCKGSCVDGTLVEWIAERVEEKVT